ncbi:mandelate racemase/muconate lactonizing enzyme family protein [Paenibacillus antri]|uniref:Mandelate racemase/muconate lactonizing enzyme family protein n=1 Tax=Paenibacillus antri TaxID=2582848 RepID=A0A5R9GK78_9BACL|nr:mandelate racemase/muconate lactonizing enzyme family protein [Paenibacillus antri]TLS53868.1 mandelate racemase/muconate lactonizing enzyme family protein [Paenibacillus antri]
MNIVGLESIVLQSEVKRPVSDALHTFDAGTTVVTKVHTDEGIVGCATTHFGRAKAGAAILKTILDKEIAPLLIGEDPHFSRKVREKLWFATEYYGVTGITQFAVAAVDICLWDIVGKASGKPVCHLLGGARDRIPAYAMVGWYYERERDYLEHCVAAVEEGFKAIKLKVGKHSLEDDIRRIESVRNEVGPDVTLMVDANQIFDETEALRRGRAYQELGIYWYEEPLAPYRTEGYVRLSQKLDIPIALGENYYTRHQFYDAIRMNAGAIYQPDNRRTGGVTEWMEIGALAEAAGRKIASHGGGAGNVNILCALPNAVFLESGSLKHQEQGMFATELQLIDGSILLPSVPGMGTEVREAYIQKHRVS